MLKQIQAGNTFEYAVNSGEYIPSDGWSCLMYLRGRAGGPVGFIVESIVENDKFVLQASAAETALFKAGDYKYFISVEKDENRFLVEEGTVEVLQDYADENFNIKSHAQKILNAIDATLLKRATKDQLSYKIAGREISKIPIPDLLALRTKVKNEIEAEERADRLAKGLGLGNIVKLRF